MQVQIQIMDIDVQITGIGVKKTHGCSILSNFDG